MSEVLTDFGRFLPAIYATVEPERNPIAALVALWSDLYRELEDTRETAMGAFSGANADGRPERDFLSWLAGWVALNADNALFGDETGTARPRLRHSIDAAVRLYARRGTVAGLCDMAREFLDADISIEEWNWPAGLTVGETATIGIDTFLTDRIDLATCFIARWHPRAPLAEAETDLTQLDVPLCRAAGEPATIIAGGAAQAPAAWLAELRGVRRLLDLEKPAHAACYLTPDPRHPPVSKPVISEPMIVGVSSVIGLCVIEQAI